MRLDAIDRKILAALQGDGRMSIADLAAAVGLSPSPCLRRVRALEESGLIARYVAVLDQRISDAQEDEIAAKTDRDRQKAGQMVDDLKLVRAAF